MGINTLKPYIFLSYAHDDAESVDKIYQYFSKTNLPCWIDKDNIRGKEKYHAKIAQAIRDCSIFISIVSNTYLEKEFCSKECEFAAEQHKNSLCIYIEKGVTVDTNHGLGIQFLYAGENKPGFNLDWSNDENSFNKLFEEIEKTIYIKAFRNHLLNGNDTTMPYLDESEIPFNTLLNNSQKTYNNSGNYVTGEISKDLFPKFRVIKNEDKNRKNNNKVPDAKNNLENIIDFIEKNYKQNILMIGDGGSGKTVSILNIIKYYNENYIPAIYIPLQSVYFEHSKAIEEYIKEDILKDEYLKDIIPKIAKYNEDLIIEKDKAGTIISNKFRLLVFLDGFNEIHTEKIQEAKNQISRFLNDWSGAQFVITSRNNYINAEEIDSNVKSIKLLPLDDAVVEEYLLNHDISIDVSKKTFTLLKNPLMLSLFVSSQKILPEVLKEKSISKPYIDVDISSGLDSPSKIIWAFLQSQLYKSIKKRKATEISECHTVIEFLLPALAAHFFDIDNPENFCRKSLTTFVNKRLQTSGYFDLYKEQRLDDVQYWYDDVKDISLRTLINTATKELNLLIYKDEEKEILDFTHQEFRDFFAAIFYSNEIKNIFEIEEGPDDLFIGKTLIEESVTEYVIDILKEREYTPICDNDKQKWDYQCNLQSPTYKCLEYFRKHDNPFAPANVIKILKNARNTDLSNCDFSNLNLTKTQLNNCVFYRFFKGKKYPSSFESSTINKENLIFDGHFDTFGAACIKNNILAVFDNSQCIKFWDINSTEQSCINTLENICYDIKHMKFFPSDNKLIAASNHEIIVIDIDGDKNEVVYSTNNFIRDIFVEDDTIKYTTLTNPFNLKSIYNDSEEDSCNFKGISSASAINTLGDQIAIGHVCGYTSLKVYDYDRNKAIWIDKKVNFYNDTIGSMDYIPYKNIIIYSVKNKKTLYKYDTNSNTVLKKIDLSNGEILSIQCFENKVIVVQRTKLYIFDENFNLVFTLYVMPNNISALIPSDNNEHIYVGNRNMFYEFDSNLECKNAYKLPSSEMVIGRRSTSSEKYFFNIYHAISLESGNFLKSDKEFVITDKPELRVYGRVGYKKNKNILTSIDTVSNSIIARAVIQPGLIINHCNFKKIKGTMTEYRYLKILKQYGAEL